MAARQRARTHVALGSRPKGRLSNSWLLFLRYLRNLYYISTRARCTPFLVLLDARRRLLCYCYCGCSTMSTDQSLVMQRLCRTWGSEAKVLLYVWGPTKRDLSWSFGNIGFRLSPLVCAKQPRELHELMLHSEQTREVIHAAMRVNTIDFAVSSASVLRIRPNPASNLPRARAYAM